MIPRNRQGSTGDCKSVKVTAGSITAKIKIERPPCLLGVSAGNMEGPAAGLARGEHCAAVSHGLFI